MDGGVAPGEFRVVLVVATADDAGGGDVLASALLDDVAVAVIEALVGEVEVAQAVVLVDIDPGVVEHEVGFDLFEESRQMLL